MKSLNYYLLYFLLVSKIVRGDFYFWQIAARPRGNLIAFVTLQ